MSKSPEKIVRVVRDAGGRIVGRTRLQKLCFLLEAAGLGEGYRFEYRHYGPYSEEVAASASVANALQMMTEREAQANWGGFYSVYQTQQEEDPAVPAARRDLARLAADADPVQLELAATALFLSTEGFADAWSETAKRKPEKADGGRLEAAKALYVQIRNIETPNRLPQLND